MNHLAPRPSALARQLDAAAVRHTTRSAPALPRHRAPDRHMATLVIGVVAELYGIPPAELAGTSRQGHLVEPRRLICQLLFERDLGPSAIGRVMGRDHSTVLHALTQMETHLSAEAWDVLQMARRIVRARLAHLAVPS